MDDEELDNLLDHLGEVSVYLQSLYKQTALLSAAQTRGQLDAFYNSQEDTLKGREKEAEYATLDLTEELRKKRAEIDAYCEERDHFRFLITARMGQSSHASSR